MRIGARGQVRHLRAAHWHPIERLLVISVSHGARRRWQRILNDAGPMITRRRIAGAPVEVQDRSSPGHPRDTATNINSVPGPQETCARQHRQDPINDERSSSRPTRAPQGAPCPRHAARDHHRLNAEFHKASPRPTSGNFVPTLSTRWAACPTFRANPQRIVRFVTVIKER